MGCVCVGGGGGGGGEGGGAWHMAQIIQSYQALCKFKNCYQYIFAAVLISHDKMPN